MNSMKNKVLLTLMILLMNQNVWSQTLDLYCLHNTTDGGI